MTTTIYVWNNNVVSNRSYCGHASMDITSAPISNFDHDLTDHFVSWMPQDGLSHSGKELGASNANILADLEYEGYTPDHVIQIPTSDRQKQKMINYWQNYRNKTIPPEEDARPPDKHGTPAPSYHFLSKNCSTTVSRVLKSGGMWSTVNPLKVNFWRKHAVWTPLDVKTLAMGYKGAKKLQWVDWVDEQQLTGNEREVLKYYMRRHARHGSSKAPARNKAPINVRVLHLIGGTTPAPYRNDAIKDAIVYFGTAGHEVNVFKKIPNPPHFETRKANIQHLRTWLTTGDYEWLNCKSPI